MASAEEMAHLRDRLESLRPDGKLLGMLPSGDCSINECTEEQRKEVKVHKDSFLAAEAQRLLLEVCLENDILVLQERMSCIGRDLGAERQDAKRRNQAVKLESAKAAEEHDRLRKEVLEHCREEAALFEECQTTLRMLSEIPKKKALDDVHADSHAAEQTLSALGNSSRTETVDEALKAKHEQPQRLAKIRRLEDELRATEQEIDRLAKMDTELEERIALEKQESCRLEQLATIDEQFGLPKITFDDKNNIVILGPYSQGIEHADLDLRSVKVQYHDDGRLKRAEPHHLLGLWNEASAAVEKDDLAFLLTYVWDSILKLQQRQPQQQHGHAGRQRGAAALMHLATELGGA